MRNLLSLTHNGRRLNVRASSHAVSAQIKDWCAKKRHRASDRKSTILQHRTGVQSQSLIPRTTKQSPIIKHLCNSIPNLPSSFHQFIRIPASAAKKRAKGIRDSSKLAEELTRHMPHRLQEAHHFRSSKRRPKMVLILFHRISCTLGNYHRMLSTGRISSTPSLSIVLRRLQ